MNQQEENERLQAEHQEWREALKQALEGLSQVTEATGSD